MCPTSLDHFSCSFNPNGVLIYPASGRFAEGGGG